MSINFEDIKLAADRIKEHAVRTPLIEADALSKHAKRRVFIKLENFQRTGSFKFRGAFNRLVQLTPAQREAGVVAWSSGNHAQGIAAAAEILSIPATIVMPEDAPSVKISGTRAYGADIIFYDRYKESREEIAAAFAAETSATLVPSYDDDDIIAGQGTCGLEIIEQTREMGLALEAAIICCGGGGLIAGSSLAIKTLSSKTNVYSVEPAGFDDHARSLVSGRRELNDPDARSICDALLAPQPGELTFPINRETLAGGLVVTDDEVRDAIRFAHGNLKFVCEPGGAVALAAVLAGKAPPGDGPIAIVVSGGNIDPAMYALIIAEAE